MANTITLKRRINSIRNTRQITKAMELVSASKMRRAQEQAKLSRDYRQIAYEILARVSQLKEAQTHPLFAKREVKAKLYIVITSNSGLAGAYNSNVLKMLTHSVIEDQANKIKSVVLTIGNKGAQFVRRLEDIDLLAVYPAFGDQPSEADIQPILTSMMNEYEAGRVDEVYFIYTQYISNLVQKTTKISLLPAEPVTAEDSFDYKYDFTNFEPSIDVVLDRATKRLIEVQIWQGLLESLASEHSMRMIAMKNATDNANDLIGDYTLEYNTARQADITQELAEITGGAEALKD